MRLGVIGLQVFWMENDVVGNKSPTGETIPEFLSRRDKSEFRENREARLYLGIAPMYWLQHFDAKRETDVKGDAAAKHALQMDGSYRRQIVPPMGIGKPSADCS